METLLDLAVLDFTMTVGQAYTYYNVQVITNLVKIRY